MIQKRSYKSDVESIDTVMAALYDTISFEPGGEPEWPRLRYLFIEGGTLTPPQPADGPSLRALGVEAFIERAKDKISGSKELIEHGFVEREIARRVTPYANFVHILSTYEGAFADADDAPIVRGINSVQLLLEDGRWWVASIVWADETPGNPIPSEFLP